MKSNAIGRLARLLTINFEQHMATPTAALTAFVVLASAVVFVVAYLSNIVYIVDGDKITLAITHGQNPEEILASEGITISKYDVFRMEEPIGRFKQLTLVRSYPVTVVVDGEEITYQCVGGTVRTLLETNGIEVGPHDHISHNLDDIVVKNDKIVIVRVTFESYTETESIPKEVVQKGTSLLRQGRTKVLEKGEDGVLTHTYHHILEDGKVVDTIYMGSQVTKEPQTETVLVGDGSSISRLDYSDEFPLDENGNPIKYEMVYHNQKATGYYAGPRAYGAAVYADVEHPDLGTCVAGTVAIRSNEIPYGTRMYIKTPDGKFVYGYAIANDTGTGLLEGKIDVDLYYESYPESALNGAKFVDIYILAYPS